MDLEDIKINVKIKLALFWVALMFFYLYNDLLSFFKPGTVEELVGGSLEGIVFTQELLFGAALLMALPSIMIFLSLTLKAKLNRMVNIILGISGCFMQHTWCLKRCLLYSLFGMHGSGQQHKETLG